MVIAETQAEIRTLTVGRAVAELDMTGYPLVMFRNAAHGGLAVVPGHELEIRRLIHARVPDSQCPRKVANLLAPAS